MLLTGEALRPHVPSLVALLDDAARRAPDRPFLVERDDRDVWHQATFATLAKRSRNVAAAVRALGASIDRPVLIAAPNGIEHATVAFGAMRAGIPIAPVRPPGPDAGTGVVGWLRAVASAVRPRVVFARDAAAWPAAVRDAVPDAVLVTAGSETHAERDRVTYAELVTHRVAPDGMPPVDGDAIAKLLFVPGAGEPKGVVTTHAMVCAMLEGVTQAWPFLEQRPPVVADWLPWHRAFGGNLVLGLVLRHAGTLYVDHGDPTPDRFARTVRLRGEIAPTLAFDVPFGWSRWADVLRGDDELRYRWLGGLDRACWYGAPLAPRTRDALCAMRVPLTGCWGATETASAATMTAETNPRYDAIGAPLAGVELKLAPVAGGAEARVRGASVAHAYWWRSDLTAAAFDEEGYFRSGDRVRPVDARAPRRGLAFAGRLDDRFTLSSGESVDRAAVRATLLVECSDIADALVSGEGHDEIGVIVWPNAGGARLDPDVLRAQVLDALRRAGAGPSAATPPRRALIVDREPSSAERRALLVRLHASEPDAEVIVA